MRNFALVFVMFCALLGALGWMAFTGVGATHSNAPPVVVDLGTQAQPFHPSQPQPEVSLKSEPMPPTEVTQPVVVRRAERTRIAKPLLVGNLRAPAELRRPVRAVRKAPMRVSAKRPEPQIEPAAHLAPSVPAAEHYSPTLTPSPERGRDLPIEVRKLPDASSPTLTSLEADREWRRQTLDRWAREESQSLGQQVKRQKQERRPETPKRKKRSRHRLLFISW